MKIAYLIHDFRRFEGQGRYTVELATRCSREHEVHVFANHVETYDDCARIRFHHVPSWRENVMTTLLTFAINARGAVGKSFDLVHSQGFCTFGGELMTAHICNRAWHRALQASTGGLTAKEQIFDTVTKTLEGSNYRSRRLRRVIAVSERVARDLRTVYSCRAPIDVIPHGVDLAAFHPRDRATLGVDMRRDLGLAADDFAFLYVGDLRKGARSCLAALAGVPDAQFLFVSRSVSAPYEAYAQELGVRERVRFLPSTTHVEAYYAAANAFVLPTPYDAFAMVVTEAMSAGLPVIVSREAGAAELIDHGRNGLVLDRYNDVESLRRLLEELAGFRARASEIGAAARHTAEQLSWDAISARTLAVYRRMEQCA